MILLFRLYSFPLKVRFEISVHDTQIHVSALGQEPIN